VNTAEDHDHGGEGADDRYLQDFDDAESPEDQRDQNADRDGDDERPRFP
jgi:hypothetical protein